VPGDEIAEGDAAPFVERRIRARAVASAAIPGTFGAGYALPMTEATVPATPDFPIVERLYRALPWAPGWVGVFLGAVLYASFLGYELALGRQPLRFDRGLIEESGEALITLLLCVLLAYLCTATLSAARAGPQAIARLLPLLGLSDREGREILVAASNRPKSAMRIAGALGLLIGVAAPLVEPNTPFHPYDVRHWTPESAWHRFLGPAVGFWALRLVAVMLIDSGHNSKLAARIPSIDLLDLEPLGDFARLGLSNALRVVWIAALFSPFALDLENYAFLLATIAIITTGSATTVLVLPVRGIHRRIRQAKQDELARVNRAIRGDAAALAASAIADRGEPASLADLIAYRGLVESAREWPFDASTIKRFGLYLLIPLGSWSGGALVERMIDTLLD
jgi:hypothetical protein